MFAALDFAASSAACVPSLRFIVPFAPSIPSKGLTLTA